MCSGGATGTCANMCAGSTFACPGSGGKPNCGSWDFESPATSQPIEGWFEDSETDWDLARFNGSGGVFTVSSAHAFTNTHSLEIGHALLNGQGWSAARVHLCSGGQGVTLQSRTLSFGLFLEPDPGVGDIGVIFSEMNYQLFNGTTEVGLFTINDPQVGAEFWPSNQWISISTTLNPADADGVVTDVSLAFRTFNQVWTGRVYFDNIQIQ